MEFERRFTTIRYKYNGIYYILKYKYSANRFIFVGGIREYEMHILELWGDASWHHYFLPVVVPKLKKEGIAYGLTLEEFMKIDSTTNEEAIEQAIINHLKRT
tara:strand:- start:777 stop:1082 length:306 start_codon:yes stop_codon:yes gene_type:complete